MCQASQSRKRVVEDAVGGNLGGGRYEADAARVRVKARVKERANARIRAVGFRGQLYLGGSLRLSLTGRLRIDAQVC